jgi:GntR family transcriptional regulator of vanillate catabolism
VTLETGQPQTIRAILGLRKLIIEGQLPPGERVLEQTLVDLLDVSRTPARAALLRVCEEGLLDPIPGGGYAVARASWCDDVTLARHLAGGA